MNADEKRKVFEELLEEYQNYIESEFSYEDGEREAECKAWLNKYDGIKEPLIKDEKIRKAVRAWADINGTHNCDYLRYDKGSQSLTETYTRNEISFNYKFETLEDGKTYTIAELCGEEEE